MNSIDEIPVKQASGLTVGTENNVLLPEQQQRLNNTKVQLNMQNEHYLRAHPEIQSMVSVFVHQVLEQKPDDILSFAGDFFTRPDLYAMVKKKTEERSGNQG